MKPSVWDRRRIFTVVFFTLLSLFALTRLEPFYRQAFSGFAWDFAINRTAAHGLLAEVSPYDRAALHQLAIAQITDQQ
jgi:di/tricarboxylate transporter